MPKDPAVLQIEIMFKGLDKVGSSTTMPSIGTLSDTLKLSVGTRTTGSIRIGNDIATGFATASVEMWHRAIHSLLISSSLTRASSIWSSVAGYYSSHYIMRAMAHLFGYFQLHTAKVIIQLQLNNTPFSCDIIKKDGGEREHKLYWKFVKGSKFYRSDPFFYANIDSPPPAGSFEFRSDGGHRNRANYHDHVGRFPVFNPLNEEELKKRLSMLSTMEINDIPVPDVYKFPDIDAVQLLAYHRILKYRSLLDEILPSKHKYWSIQRSPTFCPEYFNFSPPNIDYSGILSGLST